MKLDKIKNLFDLNYAVVYKSDYEHLKYSPIIEKNKSMPLQYSYHILDDELARALVAFNYILHLPRSGFDVCDLAPKMINQSIDTPHHIIPIPSNCCDDFIKQNSKSISLIIYDDTCDTVAKNLEDKLKPFLGCVLFSELSNLLLKDHWNRIGDKVKNETDNLLLPCEYLELQDIDNIHKLSALFYSNQFNYLEIFSKILGENSNFEHYVNYFFHLHAYKEFLDGVEEIEDLKNCSREDLLSKRETVQSPLVISMTGISSGQLKFTKSDDNLPIDQYHAIKIMATHRAIAISGIVLEINKSLKNLFVLLDHLENHCTAKHDNKYIWKTLEDMGEYICENLGNDKMMAMVRSSYIEVFSDFPIGLAVMPGATSPLCCFKQISYRPLTPISRSLAIEFSIKNQLYIGKGSKIKLIIAECLEKCDKIRPNSDVAMSSIQSLQEDYENLSIVYKEISSVDDFKHFLKDNEDAQFLLISTHGSYDRANNFTGLVMGKHLWLPTEDDLRVPPIVLLSACSTSSRGIGAVTVSDLFLRLGARVILGTLIPVNVNRNAFLVSRFLVNIFEAGKGNMPFKNLSEVWTHVVAGNALFEILASSPKLTDWANKPNKKGIVPIEDFMKNRSANSIRAIHVYEDTIAILREMAQKDDKQDLFDSVINSTGVFPESIFYQMIGYPEQILLQNEAFEQNIQRGLL